MGDGNTPNATGAYPDANPQLIKSMKLAAKFLKEPAADLPDYLQLTPDEQHFADADEEPPVEQPAPTLAQHHRVVSEDNFRVVTWAPVGDLKGLTKADWPNSSVLSSPENFHDGDRCGIMTGRRVVKRVYRYSFTDTHRSRNSEPSSEGETP